MATNKFDPYVFKNSFAAIINVALESTVERRIELVKKIVDREHSSFFPILADKIIGVTQPPNLNGYGKNWYELTEGYTNRRSARTNGSINSDQFYKNTGNLAGTLKRMNVQTAFGRPTITMGQVGTYGNQQVNVSGNSARISKTGRFISLEKVKNLKYTITVDLFPKITEDTSTKDIMTRNYIKGKTGYKLTNDGESRPIVTPFIRWWLNVHMKQKIIKGI